MKKSIAEELKKIDVQIGRKMFEISKDLNIGLPPSPLQGRILDYLIMNQGKNINGKDLERFLDVSKVAISNALFSMEKSGIIERIKSARDGRNKNIKLTQKSLDVFNQMSTIFLKLENEITKGIDENDINIFYEVLEKISKNIGDENK